MKEFFRKLFYAVSGKETKWDYLWDGKQYNWKKLRLRTRRKDMIKKIFTVIAITVLLPSMAFCIGPYIDKHNAVWDANSESDLAGYYLYWRTPTGTFSDDNRVQVPVSGSPLFDLNSLGLTSGDYFIAVSAYDTANNESSLSTEVAWDASYPSTPINLRNIAGS